MNGSNSAVIQAVDWLGVDAYPYFQTSMANGIDNGPQLFFDAYDATVGAAGGKDVWITETGWPVSGPVSGQAEANVENAKFFWEKVACPSLGKINTYWYTLQDSYPNTPSPSFGVVGSTLSTTPLFDLSCPSDDTTLPTSGKDVTSSSETEAPTSSIVASSGSAAPTQGTGNGAGGVAAGSGSGNVSSTLIAVPSSGAGAGNGSSVGGGAGSASPTGGAGAGSASPSGGAGGAGSASSSGGAGSASPSGGVIGGGSGSGSGSDGNGTVVSPAPTAGSTGGPATGAAPTAGAGAGLAFGAAIMAAVAAF